MDDLPDVGERSFEPEIISPSRAMGRRLIVVPIGFALLGYFLLSRTAVLPPAFRIRQIGGFGYLIAMAIGVSVRWVWKTTVRPTYIRLAPGVVQVLEFGLRRTKPAIRSYPMDCDTLVLVTGAADNRRFTLLRGEQSDKFELRRMLLTQESQQRFWEALLSTAPTPPLSDEELLG